MRTSKIILVLGGLTVALPLAVLPKASATAATVEFLAGPLSLLNGQVAEVGFQDPNEFSCTVGVQILAGTPAGRAAFVMTPMADTIGNPDLVPAGRGLVVGISNPNLVPPGERRMVQARVRCTCAAAAATVRTGLAVTLAVRDAASGRTAAVLTGMAR